MDYGKEFKKYATKHLGLNSLYVDKYADLTAEAAGVFNLTPNIIEERQMNAVAMDIFSRLMMDRIIFLGVPIYDDVANIIMGQLLFLESTNPKRDIQIYVNSPGGSVYAGLAIYDTMQYISSDVATICTGMAASMGAVLMSAGEAGKRTALKLSGTLVRLMQRYATLRYLTQQQTGVCSTKSKGIGQRIIDFAFAFGIGGQINRRFNRRCVQIDGGWGHLITDR